MIYRNDSVLPLVARALGCQQREKLGGLMKILLALGVHGRIALAG